MTITIQQLKDLANSIEKDAEAKKNEALNREGEKASALLSEAIGLNLAVIKIWTFINQQNEIPCHNN